MVAPAEFLALGLDRGKFKSSDGGKSYRGPCSWCGGERRFCVFTHNPYPHWRFACDDCRRAGWIDSLCPELRAIRDPDWEQDLQDRRVRLEAQKFQRREKFSTSAIWETYHANLRQVHRQRLIEWGIDQEWQDFLQIGFTPKRGYYAEGKLLQAPAFTFPYWSEGKVITLQYRLSGANLGDNRYRFEKGLGTHFYTTDPYHPICGDVLICEGVKKSIVVAARGRLNCTILAIPSRSDFGKIEMALKDTKRRWVLLDPDAVPQAKKLASLIDAKPIYLTQKVDDYLLEDKHAWKKLRQIVR